MDLLSGAPCIFSADIACRRKRLDFYRYSHKTPPTIERYKEVEEIIGPEGFPILLDHVSKLAECEISRLEKRRNENIQADNRGGDHNDMMRRALDNLDDLSH